MVARKESGKVPTHPYKTARREAAQSRKTVPVKDMDNALVVAQIERLDDRRTRGDQSRGHALACVHRRLDGAGAVKPEPAPSFQGSGVSRRGTITDRQGNTLSWATAGGW